MLRYTSQHPSRSGNEADWLVSHQQLHKHPPRGHRHPYSTACTHTAGPTPGASHTRRPGTSGPRGRPLGLTAAAPHAQPGSPPPRPSGRRLLVIPRHLVTPRGPDGRVPAHPDTPRGRSSHAQLALWARDKSWPRPGPRAPAAAEPPAPASGHTPPTCPGAGAGESGPSTSGRLPHRAPAGRPDLRTASRRANPGPGGPPPPASAGSPGGEGSQGEPGSGLEPQLPSQPPRGRKQGRGRPAQVFLPPLPQMCLGPGTGSVREGEREGRGERETENPLLPSIYGHQCAVSFVSTVNVCVCDCAAFVALAPALCFCCTSWCALWFLCPDTM